MTTAEAEQRFIWRPDLGQKAISAITMAACFGYGMYFVFKPSPATSSGPLAARLAMATGMLVFGAVSMIFSFAPFLRMDPDCLAIRNFRRVKRIPYDSIASIVPVVPGLLLTTNDGRRHRILALSRSRTNDRGYEIWLILKKRTAIHEP
ncbi:hypothetical protein KGQ20_29980 [Catenulispora sp. NF23]|uniref:PH domain-containing protein n=1 Tax=Catenulispora pinistramenti TaxID=2705254 RepID=A0ABS5KV56_9ACTN|nr:hypothetical protein [Catenulispora pinistramenti]MBS2536996.1 hypothetical protein [Catenulispora pinistramenti]MBS2549937.1 hypothetical protein [Catenulispora pinistramenti]